MLSERLSRGVRYRMPKHADDLIHNTFLTVVEAIKQGKVRDFGCFPGFAGVVLRRQEVRHVRTFVEMRTRREVELDTEFGVSASDQDPEKALLSEERRSLMSGALEALRPREREILERFYLDEQTPQQICDEMDLTDTQFRLLKSRAKARMAANAQKKGQKPITFALRAVSKIA
jgi:RNA polymerase sigma-70 factor, ECF subfamily